MTTQTDSRPMLTRLVNCRAAFQLGIEARRADAPRSAPPDLVEAVWWLHGFDWQARQEQEAAHG